MKLGKSDELFSIKPYQLEWLTAFCCKENSLSVILVFCPGPMVSPEACFQITVFMPLK